MLGKEHMTDLVGYILKIWIQYNETPLDMMRKYIAYAVTF